MPTTTTTTEQTARLGTRTYTITWQWRHDDPGQAKRSDEVRAAHVEAAVAKLRANLGTEHAFRAGDLVIVDCRSDD